MVTVKDRCAVNKHRNSMPLALVAPFLGKKSIGNKFTICVHLIISNPFWLPYFGYAALNQSAQKCVIYCNLRFPCADKFSNEMLSLMIRKLKTETICWCFRCNICNFQSMTLICVHSATSPFGFGATKFQSREEKNETKTTSGPIHISYA